MTYYSFIFVCFQIILLNEVLAMPPIRSNSFSLPTTGTPIQTSVVPNSVLSGTAAQIVSPDFIPNWPANARSVPLVTEIVPSLQFGEINVDGDLPVGGMIKISGTFPVFGSVAVDGAVPSYGVAYVDTANMFQPEFFLN